MSVVAPGCDDDGDAIIRYYYCLCFYVVVRARFVASWPRRYKCLSSSGFGQREEDGFAVGHTLCLGCHHVYIYIYI